MSINLFGIFNFDTNKMNSFIYPAYESGKGGDDVCSLLWINLNKHNVFDNCPENSWKKLTLLFDNCTGQNKNRMVLRFISYLVAKGYYRHLEVLYLISGHTKNICDTMFNSIKKHF